VFMVIDFRVRKEIKDILDDLSDRNLFKADGAH
jgi:hypothetical protein